MVRKLDAANEVCDSACTRRVCAAEVGVAEEREVGRVSCDSK